MSRYHSSCCPSSLERAVTVPTPDILLNMQCFNTELEFGNFCFCYSALVLVLPSPLGVCLLHEVYQKTILCSRCVASVNTFRMTFLAKQLVSGLTE